MPVYKRTNQQTVSRRGDGMLKPLLNITLGTLVISQMFIKSVKIKTIVTKSSLV